MQGGNYYDEQNAYKDRCFRDNSCDGNNNGNDGYRLLIDIDRRI